MKRSRRKKEGEEEKETDTEAKEKENNWQMAGTAPPGRHGLVGSPCSNREGLPSELGQEIDFGRKFFLYWVPRSLPHREDTVLSCLCLQAILP